MISFLRKPIFERMFLLAKKKVESLNGLRGTISLEHLSREDQELLGEFFGSNLVGKVNLKISLSDLNETLKNSSMEIELIPFLENYFRQAIKTRQEVLEIKKNLWDRFFSELTGLSQTEVTHKWLKELKDGQGRGYRTLLGMYQDNWDTVHQTMGICITALDVLATKRETRIRTPVFAAQLTGDPHALDKDTNLGRLFFFGLQHLLKKEETDYSAESKRLLFKEAGLEDDDISSNVACFGLKVSDNDPRVNLFRSANNTKSPLTLPLRFFDKATLWARQNVYIVENPAVFSTILDNLGENTIPALICSSGQPSVAALKLMDQLAAVGCTLYYSGDFDLKGLEIGVRLFNRYEDSFRQWCFDCDTYLSVNKGIAMEKDHLKGLRNIYVPWDSKLIDSMMLKKVALYQESFIKYLVEYAFQAI